MCKPFFIMQVVWDKDLAEDSPLPWYLPLDPSRFSLSSFRLTSVGRMITRTMVSPMNSLFSDTSFVSCAIKSFLHNQISYHSLSLG
jgi:hypothetical protein